MRTVIVTFLALFLLYFFCTPRQFTLSEGNIQALATPGSTISVSYDYSNSQIYDGLSNSYLTIGEYLDHYNRSSEFPDEIKDAEKAFVNAFNTYSKNVTIVPSDAKAAYQMSFKLDKFCYGRKGGGVTADSKGWATGTVSVKDTSTGETIAKFDFKKISACPTGKEANEPALHRERGYQLVAGYLARSFNSAN